MIFLFLDNEKQRAKGDRHGFRNDNRHPNAVNVEYERKQKNCRDLKDKRSYKGNDGGGETIAKRGEKSRAENGKAHQGEGNGEDAEARDGEIKKRGVLAYEDLGKRESQPFGHDQHTDAANARELQTLV